MADGTPACEDGAGDAAHAAAAERLQRWGVARGARLGGVCIRASPLGGLGVFATRDVRAGDALISLSHELAVTARLCQRECEALRVGRVAEASALCLFLAMHRARGAASAWAPWLAAMPAAADVLSAASLAPASLAAKQAARREAVGPGAPPAFAHTAWARSLVPSDEPEPARSYEECCASLQARVAAQRAYMAELAAAHPHPELAAVVQRAGGAELLTWSFAMLYSRAFRVGGATLLLPLIDSFNFAPTHADGGARARGGGGGGGGSASAGAVLRYDASGNYVAVATRALRAGEEVLLAYFARPADVPSAEAMLAHYGFEPEARSGGGGGGAGGAAGGGRLACAGPPGALAPLPPPAMAPA